jgi:hypothetical protein
LIIALSVRLRFTTSVYPFGIFKLFFQTTSPIVGILLKTTIYKTLHRKNKGTRTPLKTGVNSGAPEVEAIPAPYEKIRWDVILVIK